MGTVQQVLVSGYSEETEFLLEGCTLFQGFEVDGEVYISEGKGIPGNFHQVEITERYEYDLIRKII